MDVGPGGSADRKRVRSLTHSSPSAAMHRALLQRRSLQTHNGVEEELLERRRQAGFEGGQLHSNNHPSDGLDSEADTELTEAVEADAEEWKQVNEKT